MFMVGPNAINLRPRVYHPEYQVGVSGQTLEDGGRRRIAAGRYQAPVLDADGKRPTYARSRRPNDGQDVKCHRPVALNHRRRRVL